MTQKKINYWIREIGFDSKFNPYQFPIIFIRNKRKYPKELEDRVDIGTTVYVADNFPLGIISTFDQTGKHYKDRPLEDWEKEKYEIYSTITFMFKYCFSR